MNREQIENIVKGQWAHIVENRKFNNCENIVNLLINIMNIDNAIEKNTKNKLIYKMINYVTSNLCNRNDTIIDDYIRETFEGFDTEKLNDIKQLNINVESAYSHYAYKILIEKLSKLEKIFDNEYAIFSDRLINSL